jgi:hypothetical protein
MGLTPFEASCRRPFLQEDLILDPEVINLVSHITQLSKFQQVLSEVGRGGPGSLSGCFLSWRFTPHPSPPWSWVLSQAPWEGHTQSFYSPPQELRLLDWIPEFTSPEPNVGHWSLASPPQNHIQIHQSTLVRWWKTSNIFSKGPRWMHNLHLVFLPFCGLFIFLFPSS